MIYYLQELQCGLSPNLTRYFGEGNLANYSNNEATNILREAYSISDKKFLKEKYNILQNIYQNERPYIGLYFNKAIVIHGKDLVGNITPNWYNVFYNIDTWYRKN